MFLSAAFHHSDKPGSLLSEIRRVLRPSGIVIVIGEHISDPGLNDRIKHVAKFLVSRLLPTFVQRRLFGRSLNVARLIPREEDLLGGDDRLGDHAYTLGGYRQLFTAGGFVSETRRRPEWAYQAFVLAPFSEVSS